MGPKLSTAICGNITRFAYSLVFLAYVCFLSNSGPAAAAVYTQEAFGCDPTGQPLPQVVIDQRILHDLTTYSYSLGAHRSLEIRTNLNRSRQLDIDVLATVVQRCYIHLEAATGRQVPGGVLLYLLAFEQRPRTYRFETTTDESDNWSQVRVALLDRGQPLLGAGASRHVTEFIYDTLPHELTHNLLTVVPTVRHDRDGGPTLGTRWFIDGTCELMAKSFAAREVPDIWRDALISRRVYRTPGRPELYDLIWQWGQNDKLAWSDESDLYGISLLLVSAWTSEIELPELLQLMAGRGGDLDGVGLLTLLQTTAGLGQGELETAAQWVGRQSRRPAQLSLQQIP